MAVKVLRLDLVRNPKFFKMFTKEAELLRKLEHPYIVRLYEFEQDGNLAFLVMDWIEGTNLRESISNRKSPYSPEDAACILLPVCSALHYAHQNHVFHCDVKPANILLHVDGRVLLTDFGVARLAAEYTSGGTPAYMAPELFTDQAIDGRSDVYSLGVTLYEMLTGGNLPFRGDTQETPGTTARERIAWEHVYQPAPPPRHFNARIPDAVEAVILTCLNKRPEDRYAHPMALREAFEYARERGDGRGGSQRTVVGERTHPGKKEARRGGELPPELEIRGPFLYALRGELAGRAIGIPRSGLTIGRSRRNRLQLRERSVSRTHATILQTRHGLYIRDEGSSLGTFVNESRISGPTALRAGDRVRIGYDQVFEFRVK
jgi:serine/threonine protein kinase